MMFDDERDFEKYFVRRHEEERRILTWRSRRSDVSGSDYNSDAPMANEFNLGIIILSVCYIDLFSNYITYNYV